MGSAHLGRYGLNVNETFDLPDADVLLVVPPLAHLTWPSLGVHVLQACARGAGFEARVLYANVIYGSRVGPLFYADLANAPTDWLLGERLFARAAFRCAPFGRSTEAFHAAVAAHGEVADQTAERYLDHLSDATGEVYARVDTRYPRDALDRAEAEALALIDALAQAIAAKGYRVVGASTTFDQTAASLALLERVKSLAPSTVTVLGGANCEGPMADALAALAPAVDHVFAGESEAVFVAFLEALRDGGPPAPRVIRGAPCQDLDALPNQRFHDYFEQVAAWLPEIGDTPLWLSYETSRGCWWGQKSHCTFCGLNGSGMGFREKSPEKVLDELGAILAESPTRRVAMTDNIMPHRYHTTLVPKLPAALPGLHIFYEQKANLTLPQVKALWDAGAGTIQPGIEALDTALLQLVRKGVRARQNVALLRYARSVGMAVKWNLLWGFPGDDAESYQRTLALSTLIPHLCPPNALTHLSIDRFSPYFEAPETWGITDLRPLPAYADVYPEHADLHGLAYHFQGVYRSGSDEAGPLMAELNRVIWRWRAAWEGDPRQRPALHVHPAGPGRYTLIDTRGLGGPQHLFLDRAQAEAVLVGGPRDRVARAEWAIRNRFAADLDGWCVALATAPYALLAALEQSASAPSTAQIVGLIQPGTSTR